MNFVYALKCSNDKFYVGQTTDIVRRFLAHKEGSGSAWTKMHPAESIVKLNTSTGHDFQELATTLEFMDLYGIDNVRGGPFSNVHMPPEHVRTITKLMISNAFPKKWIPKESDAHLFNLSTDEPDPVAKRPRTDANRHGQPWSKEEDEALINRLKNTWKSFFEISEIHERTEGSIKSKIREIIDRKEKTIEEYSKEYRIDFSHDGRTFKRAAETIQ
jgi:predicted GIY-YIG superfamily endonuclease